MALLDDYMPADMPTGEVDPRELERARYLAMMRLGLGMAGREPLGSAAGGAIKAYVGAQGNARQNMLAQLQAYKARQEIGAKAQAAQTEQELATEAAGIYGNTPLITQPGGPTNANAALQGNATFGMVEQLRQHAILFYKKGKTEDGKRLMDSAKDMVVKYGLTPYYSLDSNGMLQASQLSDTGQVKVLPGRPAEEQSFQDTGSSIIPMGKMTATPGTAIPKTLTPEGRISAGNLDLAQKRFAYEKTAPVWDAGSRQFIIKPTEAAPMGSAVTPTGVLPPHGKSAPEGYTKQVSGIVNVNTAIENYLQKLRGFTNLDQANTTKRAQIGTAYNNTMLQLKEAYNLGVLNGPDYSILTTVLTDPLSIKGAVTSNDAIAAQAKQIRTVLRSNAQNLARVHKQPLSDIDEWLPEQKSSLRSQADAIIGGGN